MNDDPRQPQAIADRQYPYHGERLAQAFFGPIRQAEIQQDCTHAKHGMCGHGEQEQHFKHKDDRTAQVRHHISEITQSSFSDEVVRDEVQAEQ